MFIRTIKKKGKDGKIKRYYVIEEQIKKGKKFTTITKKYLGKAESVLKKIEQAEKILGKKLKT